MVTPKALKANLGNCSDSHTPLPSNRERIKCDMTVKRMQSKLVWVGLGEYDWTGHLAKWQKRRIHKRERRAWRKDLAG